MTLKLIHWLASKLQRRDICGEDGTLYLQRFRVLGWMPGSSWRLPFSIYLHRFARADLDDAPHSHPWAWAFSLVLHGGYLEMRANGADRSERSWRWLMPLSMNWLWSDTYHVVTTIKPETWTLFIVGPKAKSWGFWVAGRGHVPWRERLAERGIQADY
jgi:hypothetical protein